MPPSYVKPYVKRSKNDTAGAAAICEAARSAGLGPAAHDALRGNQEPRAAERPDVASQPRASDPPAHQAGQRDPGTYGGVRDRGAGLPPPVKELLAVIADQADERIPPLARICLEGLAVQLMSLEREIGAAERRIHTWHRSNQASQRAGGLGPGCDNLQVRAGAGGLDRISAEADLDRRQGAARADLQTG